MYIGVKTPSRALIICLINNSLTSRDTSFYKILYLYVRKSLVVSKIVLLRHTDTVWTDVTSDSRPTTAPSGGIYNNNKQLVPCTRPIGSRRDANRVYLEQLRVYDGENTHIQPHLTSRENMILQKDNKHDELHTQTSTRTRESSYVR